MADKEYLTTSSGAPVSDNQHSLTAGNPGPTLLEDVHLIDKLAHFDRERIPERVVHAKGAGAHGYFEVTHNVAKWTKADFLSEVGKKTPLFIRFSTVGGEKGSADSARDPRGFAIKIYTNEGNYDIVGNNTPVFFIRDAIKFPDLIHTQKRNPQTNLKDANMYWDFFSLTPESLHQATILFSDRGTPKSYRNMDGFGSHTFKWINAAGEAFWIKYHFKADAGIENWTGPEAEHLAGTDPDYATRDLFNHLASGQTVTWTASVQIMPLADANTYRFDPFDVTKVWLHKDYPLIPFGRIVLDRNPSNYFAEVEQAAFAPTNIVPGIGFSPDKMLQGRIFSYPDTHRHRLGTNFDLLPINRPQVEVRSYARDGAMRFDENGGASVSYEPNSFGGPEAAKEFEHHPLEISGQTVRTGYRDESQDFVQPGLLYRLMTEAEKTRLIANLVGHLGKANREIQARQAGLCYKADPDYGTRLAQGLGIELPIEAAAAD
jgi:catalase